MRGIDAHGAMAGGGASGVLIVKGEIHNVLSMMRQSTRWASVARFQLEMSADHESGLVRAFRTLQDHLQPFRDLDDVDTVEYLKPFLAVVRSVEARCVRGRAGFLRSPARGRCSGHGSCVWGGSVEGERKARARADGA
jgi:hypothetical protein